MNKFHSTIYSGIVSVRKKVTKYSDGKSYTAYFLVIKGECSGLSPTEKLDYVQPGETWMKVSISEAEYNMFMKLKRDSERTCPIRANGTLEIIVDTD